MARVVSSKPVGEWEEECPHCHYLVAFVPTDIVDYVDHDEGERVRYVTCPKCHRSIDKKKKSTMYEDDSGY